jgi:hypothetical protein
VIWQKKPGKSDKFRAELDLPISKMSLWTKLLFFDGLSSINGPRPAALRLIHGLQNSHGEIMFNSVPFVAGNTLEHSCFTPSIII